MKSLVSLVPCERYDKDLIYKSIKKGLTDINFDFKNIKSVLLKPNLLNASDYKKMVVTHPVFIEAVIKILKENKINILIGDSSGGGKLTTQAALKNSGIMAVAKKYQIKLIAFETSKTIKKINKNGKILKEFWLPKELFEVDLIINLPKLKTHTFTKYTGAIKNIFGCIPGFFKAKCHLIGKTEENFSKILVDLYEIINPGLTIMDGIVGMEGLGPSYGKIKKSGIMLISKNGAALDVVASKAMGFDALEVFTNKEAVKRKLVDIKKIKTIGEIPELKFKKPFIRLGIIPEFLYNALYNLWLPIPVCNKKTCTKCRNCARSCPATAIKMKEFPEIDLKKCIHCYCCYENCPKNAIRLRRKLF